MSECVWRKGGYIPAWHCVPWYLECRRFVNRHFLKVKENPTGKECFNCEKVIKADK